MLHRARQPELGAQIVYLRMIQTTLRLHGGSKTTCVVYRCDRLFMTRCLRTYRIHFATRARCESYRNAFFRCFFAARATSGKFTATAKPCSSNLELRVHPIRAETLFTNSACLPFQIFIPYAPISRSAGYGVSRPKNRRRCRAKLTETRGARVSVATMRSRPMGEFRAHTTRCERAEKIGHFERSEPVQDIFEKFRQVVGVESIHSGDQHINHPGDTT